MNFALARSLAEEQVWAIVKGCTSHPHTSLWTVYLGQQTVALEPQPSHELLLSLDFCWDKKTRDGEMDPPKKSLTGHVCELVQMPRTQVKAG